MPTKLGNDRRTKRAWLCVTLIGSFRAFKASSFSRMEVSVADPVPMMLTDTSSLFTKYLSSRLCTFRATICSGFKDVPAPVFGGAGFSTISRAARPGQTQTHKEARRLHTFTKSRWNVRNCFTRTFHNRQKEGAPALPLEGSAFGARGRANASKRKDP